MKAIIFLAGAAVGFVLGSRSGRKTYDTLKRQVSGITHSEPVRQVADDLRDLADKAASEVGNKVSDAVGTASSKIDDISGKSGSGTTAP